MYLVFKNTRCTIYSIRICWRFSWRIYSSNIRSQIKTDFIEVDEDTRINVKLKSGDETEINAPGPSITDDQFLALLNQIKQTTKEDTVIVAGST